MGLKVDWSLSSSQPRLRADCEARDLQIIQDF